MVVMRSRLTMLIWALGCAAIAAMAITALAYLWRTSIRPWRIAPGLPIGDLAVVGAVVLLVALAIVGTYLVAGARPRAALGLSLATLVAVRLALSLTADARLYSDFLTYRGLATGMLAGYGFWTSLPPGYPLLEAIGIAVGGPSLLSGEVLNVLLELLAGVSIVLIVRGMAGDRAAAVAAMVFALMPSQILSTLVLGTEVAYGASLALVVLAAQRSTGGRAAPLIACGLLLGLSEYIRPTSQLFLPAVLVAIVLVAARPRAIAPRAALFVLAFLVTVSPIAAWNGSANGRLSLAPSLFDQWTVYVGLNVASHGQYRLSDRQQVSEVAGVPIPIVGDGRPGARFRPVFLAQARAFNDAAGALLPERLQANGVRSLTIQPAKFRAIWERADYPVALIFGPRAPQPSRDAAGVAALIVQIGWLALLGGALVALIALRRHRPVEITIVLLVLLTAVAIHSLTEVQPRYHEYYVPSLCILVGGFVGSLERARAGRATAEDRTPSAGLPAPPEDSPRLT